MKTYHTDDLMRELRGRVGKATQTAVAAELGVSLQHLNDLLMGRRKMSERVAAAMGYRMEVVFRKQSQAA